MDLLSYLQFFLKSHFFVELSKIFSIIGISIFIYTFIIYPIFINFITKYRAKNGNDY